MSEPRQVQSDSTALPYLVRAAREPGGPAFVLLHGLTGDEKVMWVLESALPRDGLIVSPRAPYQADEGGYSWIETSAGQSAELADFEPAVDLLEDWLSELEREMSLEPATTYLVGFSQGAALAFAMVASGAIRPAGVIALAGFLPEGDLSGLSSVPVYWGHGSQDEVVTVERARQDIGRLERMGVKVRYCEAEVGHKVGVECMRGLKDWLAERADQLGQQASSGQPHS